MHQSNRVEQLTDEMLAEKVANLSDEISPQRDLWSGIERAIQDKPQQISAEHFPAQNKRKNLPYMAWAASIVVAVLVTWLSLPPSLKQDSSLTAKNNDTPALSSEALANEALVDEPLVTFIQTSFTQQKQAMLVSFGQPDLTQLPEKMQVQLTQLAQARQAIENALKKDQNNIDLLNLLRFTQQQELNLLQQLLPYTGSNAPQWQTI